jgi:Fic family protein
LPNPDLIARTLDRREAVKSSQIEGTHAEVDELFEYEATGDDEGLPGDVRVTLNYVKALEVGLAAVRQAGNSAITKSLIQGLHRTLMDGCRRKLGFRMYSATLPLIKPDRMPLLPKS